MGQDGCSDTSQSPHLGLAADHPRWWRTLPTVPLEGAEEVPLRCNQIDSRILMVDVAYIRSLVD